MLAKMAETFDRLSGGRLIRGIGGGFSDEEFQAFGLAVPSPREKIGGLEEAVRICRSLWSQSKFTFAWRLYRTEAADFGPKLSHKIPIWLGAFGTRTLDLTGRLAGGWIRSVSFAPLERIGKMHGQVAKSAMAAGRDPKEIT